MKHVISTTTAPGAVGPYSQAIEANGFVFVSGQLPLDPATGAFVPGGTSEQAEQSIKNLLAVLEAAGCKAEDVVKTTVFMIDISALSTRCTASISPASAPRAVRCRRPPCPRARWSRSRPSRSSRKARKPKRKGRNSVFLPFFLCTDAV